MFLGTGGAARTHPPFLLLISFDEETVFGGNCRKFSGKAVPQREFRLFSGLHVLQRSASGGNFVIAEDKREL